MRIDVVQELKDELRKVRHERDVLNLIAVDNLVENENLSREKAQQKINTEVFEHLRGVR